MLRISFLFNNYIIPVANLKSGTLLYDIQNSKPALSIKEGKFNNGIERIMTRYVWESDKIPGISVSQIPLILSWALTIHKSQGATLDAAEIDVGSGIFECGQTYVALSRVKSLEGLYLTSFDAKRIRINKKVKEYYDALTAYHSSSPPIIQTIEEFKYKEEEELKEEPVDEIKVIKLLG